MYALSPVTGRLTDRFGSIPVIYLGMVVLGTSAALAALAPADGGVLLFFALFLLGYGWNLGYVAGSTLLASGLVAAERTRIEGATDTLIWGSAAVASLGSGSRGGCRGVHGPVPAGHHVPGRAAVGPGDPACVGHRRDPGLTRPE